MSQLFSKYGEGWAGVSSCEPFCKLQKKNVSFPARIVKKSLKGANSMILFTFCEKKDLGIESRKTVYYPCVIQRNY